MITIKSIRVHQAEGRIDKMIDRTVSTVALANSLLNQIAMDGPDLGYYKTDVTVEWSDGNSVKLRHDVKKFGLTGNDTDVTAHLKRWADYILRTPQYAHSDGAKMVVAEILEGRRAVS